MQMSEQTDLPSEGLTTKKDLSIKVENTTPTIEGKSIPESLWGQLEELEKAESLSQTHVDSFQRKRKKEEFTVETLEEGSVEESPTKSPHKSTGVTPKLESLSLSKNENRLKRLEECDLASLIEEELSRQQFLLDSLKSEESTKDLASIQQQVNAPEDEECDSYSGCDINEWVTGCQCNKCHKNVACVGCGKKGCSNCLDCCGECGSYVCGNDVVREVEGCSLQCGIHRRLFCPNCAATKGIVRVATIVPTVSSCAKKNKLRNFDSLLYHNSSIYFDGMNTQSHNTFCVHHVLTQKLFT
ncbi:hypothetical protein GAYE_SCF03G2239 [Galdieria yellowstonensis]|uniref:Zinc-finger domain-containing protein n=1 Tax=Galdieria yellowstonensis TaxID=3028027 RepID=A0AAV9IAH0_9RHOD|nr:hypothetical protein GAYE_SCF03G2239 [Galdieria yellowstonensis]